MLADTEAHGDLARLVNALSVADDFKEHGDEVTIVFRRGRRPLGG